MGESQPTLEMGPCLARHPQFGAYFRNCSNNLLLEPRVWRIEHCYTIIRGGHIRSGGTVRNRKAHPQSWAATLAEADLLRPPCRRRDRRRRPSPSL